MHLYAKTCSHLDTLALGEHRNHCKRFVEPSLWMQVQFAKHDNLLAMIDKIEETFKDLQPIFSKKVKFMDMMIMKAERPLDWAMRIDAESELADLETLKPQESKLLKFCQELKSEDQLYEKITEIDPRGWEQAKVITRKHTAAMDLKADLVRHKPRGSGHVVNSISGAPTRSPSLSPGQQRRRYNNKKQRKKLSTPGKRARKKRLITGKKRSSREISNTRLCYNCDVNNNPLAPNQRKKKERLRGGQ